jgi:chaperonin GroES
MDLKMLGDRVLVKAIEEDQTRESGLVIPDVAREKPQKGVVIAVGPGRYERGQLIPMTLAEGDPVLYTRYGGSEIRVNDEDLLVLREQDILAVLTDE